MTGKISVLFLCTGNSCRSQMAEGWARHLKGDVVEPLSAGIEKHGLNDRAVKVMFEAGVDITEQKSKTVMELPDRAIDYVITLCSHAHETCPYCPGNTKPYTSDLMIRSSWQQRQNPTKRHWHTIDACGMRFTSLY